MSNMGLENFLNENGIVLVRANVGDRYVLEKMKLQESKSWWRTIRTHYNARLWNYWRWNSNFIKIS